jgi:hypothetical protein
MPRLTGWMLFSSLLMRQDLITEMLPVVTSMKGKVLAFPAITGQVSAGRVEQGHARVQGPTG